MRITCISRHKQPASTLAKNRDLFAPCASQAVQSFIGPLLKLSAFWGWHESRRDCAGAALVVCCTFPLASIAEGCKVNHTKDNGLTADNSQPAKVITKNTVHFTGTDNPRQLRIIPALMARPRRAKSA